MRKDDKLMRIKRWLKDDDLVLRNLDERQINVCF